MKLSKVCATLLVILILCGTYTSCAQNDYGARLINEENLVHSFGLKIPWNAKLIHQKDDWAWDGGERCYIYDLNAINLDRFVKQKAIQKDWRKTPLAREEFDQFPFVYDQSALWGIPMEASEGYYFLEMEPEQVTSLSTRVRVKLGILDMQQEKLYLFKMSR